MSKYVIGVDTGGTFTDVVVIDEKGKVTVGKSPTTPQSLQNGIFDALDNAAENLGLSRKNIISNAASFCQGTTVGTNALINRQGAKLGMLTTKGFEDTVYIQRAIGRVDGLHPDEVRHQAIVKKPEPFIPKHLIIGVAERIDCFGSIVVPLNEHEVRDATKKLVQEGVEAIAVAFLWSVQNSVHEDQAAKIISETAPDIWVNTSHSVSPLIREYGRFNSVMIDTYIGPLMVRWYDRLNQRLKDEGLSTELLTAQVWGGVMPHSAMMPIGTINSGPVGGSLACKRIAELLEKPYVVATDIGGTSFDVSVIAKYEAVRAREPPIMRYRVNIPMVEITSIGAGGGTIAWVDETNHLRVGPVSAGAHPGPVCYGRSGTQPTATDADLVLGILNADYYLGGRIKLDKEAASEAITKLGKQIGLDTVETAKAIFDIQNAHMADLLRLVVTRSGYDPRDFTLFCYGGGGPTHGAVYGQELGFSEVYMFEKSAAWSAFGIASADISRIFSQHKHLVMPADVKTINETFSHLEKEAIDEMVKIGFRPEDVNLTRELSMKFGRQVNVETIGVPNKTYTEEDIDRICTSFIAYYKSLYGEGAAFVEAGIEIMSFLVHAVKPTIRPAIPKLKLQAEDASAALKGRRDVFSPEAGRFTSLDIYEFEKLRAGNMIRGPAIIEAPTTTMYILSGQIGRIDQYKNLRVTVE
ncbi:hydantoinase/oxoprolinase family protein [Chloroflexota bacterium]